MTRKEQAHAAFVDMLLEKVRGDTYPSTTQLDMIEESLPRELAPEYFDMLLEKARDDRWPSIPMLQRIQRVSSDLL